MNILIEKVRRAERVKNRSEMVGEREGVHLSTYYTIQFAILGEPSCPWREEDSMPYNTHSTQYFRSTPLYSTDRPGLTALYCLLFNHYCII